MKNNLPHVFIIRRILKFVKYFIYIFEKKFYIIFMIKTYPPSDKTLDKMRRHLRDAGIHYRYYTSLPKEVYRGYIWSLYWYNRKGFSEVNLYGLFGDWRLREYPQIEDTYLRYAEAHNLIDPRRLSVEDFAVHLHLWGDTFSKDTSTIKRELKGVEPTLYKDILDSIYYKDVYITYLPKIRHRLLIYLKKGSVYTIGRVSHKLRRKLSGLSPRYFTLRENNIISNRDKLIGIVCNRVKFYKEFYE